MYISKFVPHPSHGRKLSWSISFHQMFERKLHNELHIYSVCVFAAPLQYQLNAVFRDNSFLIAKLESHTNFAHFSGEGLTKMQPPRWEGSPKLLQLKVKALVNTEKYTNIIDCDRYVLIITVCNVVKLTPINIILVLILIKK